MQVNLAQKRTVWWDKGNDRHARQWWSLLSAGRALFGGPVFFLTMNRKMDKLPMVSVTPEQKEWVEKVRKEAEEKLGRKVMPGHVVRAVIEYMRLMEG